MDENGVIQDTADGKLISCPDYFEISTVAGFKQLFQELLDLKPEQVTFDTSKTEMIDTAALQLMLSFCTSAKSTGIQVNYQNSSEAFINGAKTLGLDTELGLAD